MAYEDRDDLAVPAADPADFLDQAAVTLHQPRVQAVSLGVALEIGHGDVLSKMTAKIRQLAGEPARQAPAPPAAAKAEARPDAAAGAAAAVATSGDRFALAEQKIAAWNTRHPVGTKAKSLVADYGDLTTRTGAMVLFGHRAAVYMEGYNGYFDLDEVAPL